jgi:thiol:disulfide interchange protein
MKCISLSIALSALLPMAAFAETFKDAVKSIEGHFEPAEAKPGQTVSFKLKIELNEYWYTYVTHQVDPAAKNSANKFILPTSGDLIFIEPVEDPADFHVKSDGDVKELRYYPGGATWDLKAVVSPKATPGTKSIKFDRLRINVCVAYPDGKALCLPPRFAPAFSADFKVLDGPAVAIDPKYKEQVEKSLAQPSNPPKVEPIEPKKDSPRSPTRSDSIVASDRTAAFLIPNSQPGFDYPAEMAILSEQISNDLPPPQTESQSSGLLSLVLVAMFWGGVTLLTPCVFPMIPITVSFFLKQGEKKLHNPLTMASVYALTIVIVLGLSAIAFLSFFRALSINPWMNVALGLLFVFFALSLFGMYDIVLPNSLVRFTSSKEGKGGYAGTIFMAISFTIVSFTCVAPFLGGFSGMMATGKFGNFELVIAGLAFAATFAAPFFVLALFPSLLKKLPKSGGWMNTIKAVMGFLELAAALKFFRTAELRWQLPTSLFTYDLVLSMWVIILFLAGLYLLNLFRLPHDEPQDHIGVPRMLFGAFSIGIGIYLLPGLFAGANNQKQRPAGTVYAWVDSFLLPEPGHLNWSSDLSAAIEEARRNNETVFVDFTGVTCTNCRLNEQNVFPLPEVNQQMKKHRLVQLYTDTVPPQSYETTPTAARQDIDAGANLSFQESKFRTEQLPLYVILKPEPNSTKTSVLAIYDEGKINRKDRFVEFLKTGTNPSP